MGIYTYDELCVLEGRADARPFWSIGYHTIQYYVQAVKVYNVYSIFIYKATSIHTRNNNILHVARGACPRSSRQLIDVDDDGRFLIF